MIDQTEGYESDLCPYSWAPALTPAATTHICHVNMLEIAALHATGTWSPLESRGKSEEMMSRLDNFLREEINHTVSLLQDGTSPSC